MVFSKNVIIFERFVVFGVPFKASESFDFGPATFWEEAINGSQADSAYPAKVGSGDWTANFCRDTLCRFDNRFTGDLRHLDYSVFMGKLLLLPWEDIDATSIGFSFGHGHRPALKSTFGRTILAPQGNLHQTADFTPAKGCLQV